MTTIYLVTDGRYSDFGVVGAFSTEGKAQEHIDAAQRVLNNPGIEEYELDSVPQPRIYASVYMFEDGDTQRINWHELTIYVSLVQSSYTDLMWGRRRGTVLFTEVETNDEERAIKVANERRTIILANNAWGDEKRSLEVLRRSEE